MWLFTTSDVWLYTCGYLQLVMSVYMWLFTTSDVCLYTCGYLQLVMSVCIHVVIYN